MKSFLCAFFALLILFAWHKALDSVVYQRDLSGMWEYTLGDGLTPATSNWQTIHLPDEFPADRKSEFDHWIYYKRGFETPDACLAGRCSILIGEVGDAVEVSVNGQILARHGEFPPKAHYEKNFPVQVDIPDKVLSFRRRRQ